MSLVATSQSFSDDATRRAIRDELRRNVFVEAGAGTGKTTSLVARLMALIESGVGVEQLVAITFTRAAAAELRVRIRQGLEALVRSGEASDVVRQALAGVDSAAFRTIDSHVQSLLREYPIESGLPPSVEIQSRTDEIESFAEQWSVWVGRKLDDDSDFVDALGRAMVLGMPNPLRELRSMAETVNTCHGFLSPVEASELSGNEASDALEDVREWFSEIRLSLEDCNDPNDRLLLYAIEVVQWWESGDSTAMASEFDAVEALGGAPEIRGKRIGSAGNWDRPISNVRSLLDQVSARFATALDALRRQVGGQLFNYALQFVTEELVATRVSDGKLSFHDGMVFAVRLLRSDERVRRAVQLQHTHVLVDEFQDTDPMQVELVELMTIPPGESDYRPGSLFCVGDPKQSIYRFRGADVQVSSGVMDRIDASAIGVALSLSENHRSSVGVIKWVNAVCGPWMSSESRTGQARWSGLAPDARARDSELQGEVYHIGDELGHASAGDSADAEADDIRAVALAVAHGRLKVSDGDGGVRESVAGDLVIITPRRTNWNRYITALQSVGVGCVAERDDEFFGSQVMRDVINCLNAIDDPTNQVAVLGALRSTWFGCSDRDFLDWVRAGGSFNYLADTQHEGFQGAVADSFTRLRAYHADRANLMPSELLESLMRERQVRELAVLREDAASVLVTLDAAIEVIRGFESGGTGTLRECVVNLEAMRDSGESLRLVPTRASETDKVRLMTIHQSKGLEFPIVLIADTDTSPSRDRAGLLLSPGARSGGDGGSDGKFAARLGHNGRYFQVGQYDEVADAGKFAETLQSTRLYYVAATRAKEVLVVSTHHKRTSRQMATPAAIMSEYASHADWIWKRVPDDWAMLPAIEATEVVTESRTESIDVDQWEREFVQVVSDASQNEVVSPSSLHGDDEPVGAEVVAKSVQDEPMDADARPGRGRAATDIGRAVHAALQQLIGVGGQPKAEVVQTAANSQAEAHGVSEYLDEIEQLVTATMHTPLLRHVMGLPPERRWVEVSVAGASRDGSGTVYDGQIDLLYELEPGKFAVVDFKTDREFGRDIATMARPYESQLRAYAEAVESATGYVVVEGTLVFSRLAITDPERATHTWSF